MRRSIKIPVKLQEDKILPLLEVCNEIYNIYVEWSFTNKTYNKNKAHKELYSSLRKSYSNVPSGLLQTIRDSALGNIKSLKFRYRPKKSKYSAISFDKRTSSLRGHFLSLSTLGKRERVLLHIPKYFQKIFRDWKFTGMQLKYDKQKRKFFACLGFKTNSPNIKNGDALGIDRGLKNIIYCSNGHKVSGKNRNRIKRKYSHNRSDLQAKGTRSSKRALARLRGREMRFSSNENHIITKEIVNLDYQIFVLEKLGKFSKNKGKRFNRKISNWSYYQLEIFLQYKAEALGKSINFVDARYTSQKCNCCGYIAKNNRKSDCFLCKKCGHSDHADLNAAKNIRDLHLRNAIPSGQAAVNQPIALPT